MSINIDKAVSIGLILTAILTFSTPRVSEAQRFKPRDDTIAEIAVTSGDFTTLVAALS